MLNLSGTRPSAHQDSPGDVAIERRPGKTRLFHRRRLRWVIPALVVALVLVLLDHGLGGGQTEVRDGLTFAADDLELALDRQLVAEQRQGAETRILLSFADKRGALCRGFARGDLSGIACRRDGGWHLRVQRDGIDVKAADAAQARSVEDAILTAAREMAAGPPLDAAAERAARARGWSPQ